MLIHAPLLPVDRARKSSGRGGIRGTLPPVRITDILTDAEGIRTVWSPEEWHVLEPFAERDGWAKTLRMAHLIVAQAKALGEL